MMERWVFGEAALEQTKRAAALLRDVTGLVLAAEQEEPAVERLIADLERAVDGLGAAVPADREPRVGDVVDGDGRVYLDHARDIGEYNPCFPEYEIVVDGDRANGTVTFPLVYEGPPGVVHGGFLALFADCVVQHHNCDVGVAGKTTELTLRFLRPTPLATPLAFAVERSAGADRIRSTVRLSAGDRLCCEAAIDALAGDRAALPAVSPRRHEVGP